MEAYAFAAQTFRVTEQDYGLQTHREGVCCAAVGVEINVWHKGAGARWALPDRAAFNERQRDRETVGGRVKERQHHAHEWRCVRVCACVKTNLCSPIPRNFKDSDGE